MKKFFVFLLIFLVQLVSRASALTHIDYELWAEQQSDLVIFSYNRPMQLYAFLESVEKYLLNPGQIHVIYRTTETRFDKAYNEVFKRFPYVHTHKQGKKPQKDFKPLVNRAVFRSGSISPYIMFAVDDIVFTEHVDIRECTKALKKHDAWFFSLRLGKNITHTILNPVFSLSRVYIGLPKGKENKKSYYTWKFDDFTAKGSWGYPNSVDVTIYRKKDLKKMLKKADYYNPNTLEAEWHWHYQPKNNKGLSFVHSKAVNIPLNVVNTAWTSANLNISAWSLLDKFLDGYKIDIDKFKGIDNPAVHMDYQPSFIKR